MKSYFTHDSNARNADNILPLRIDLGAEGYAVYFMILERLRDEPDYKSVRNYNILAFDFRVNPEVVQAVVENYGLFEFSDDGNCFYSNSFMRRMEPLKSRTEKARNNAIARWSRCDSNAMASKNDAIKRDKIKEDNIKEIKKETSKERKKEKETTTRFVKPTIEEVANYLKEKNITVFTAEKFHDYYESKGWRVGTSPMKNWRAAIATWAHNRNDTNQKKPTVYDTNDTEW